jgi:syntaxin-binding protein 1
MREPRGTLLILDRNFDLISPVVHDYCYQSLVYEFFKVGEEGEVTLNSKLAFLNDQDELWVRFRNKHIAGVHATLNAEVSAVAAESKRKVGSKSTDDMSLQDMAEVLRTMPKYEEMMKKYHIHMELINKGITDFTSNNLRKLISLEQDIISGVDSKGAKVNNTTIVKEMS